MKLVAPYSGIAVEAEGEQAERLAACGYRKEAAKEAPAKGPKEAKEAKETKEK